MIDSITKKLAVSHVSVSFPVRDYEDEDNMPLCADEVWTAIIDVHSGKIANWPLEEAYEIWEKVVDEGTYSLLDADGNIIATLNGCVPHGVIPGEYGDYVNLKINKAGVISNWPKKLNFDKFFHIKK